MESGNSFYTGEAARITGIPYRTIDHWARTGLLTPSISKGRGSGRCRLYSLGDLLALRVVRDLRATGVSGKSLRKVINVLHKSALDAPLAQVQLLVIGRDVAIVHNTFEIQSVLGTPGQLYLTPGFVFDLRKPIADVKRKIAEFHAA